MYPLKIDECGMPLKRAQLRELWQGSRKLPTHLRTFNCALWEEDQLKSSGTRQQCQKTCEKPVLIILYDPPQQFMTSSMNTALLQNSTGVLCGSLEN